METRFPLLAMGRFIWYNLVIRNCKKMIRFENVSKIYNSHSAALKNVSFEVKQQEFVSVVGRSGAGKSTLLKLLIAEEKPSGGRIFFNKNNIQLYESNFSDSYDYLYSWNERFNRERYFFEKLFKKYKTETILDCGSGNGFHVNLFLSFKGIKRVAGIEVSSLMIKKAMKNLNKADHEKVRFYKGDLTDVAKIL